jgi:hypothetical protein
MLGIASRGLINQDMNFEINLFEHNGSFEDSCFLLQINYIIDFIGGRMVELWAKVRYL